MSQLGKTRCADIPLPRPRRSLARKEEHVSLEELGVSLLAQPCFCTSLAVSLPTCLLACLLAHEKPGLAYNIDNDNEVEENWGHFLDTKSRYSCQRRQKDGARCSEMHSPPPPFLPGNAAFHTCIENRPTLRFISCQQPKSLYISRVTKPVATVLPPSRILNRCPGSIARGLYSSQVISMLSPGMAIFVSLSSTSSGQWRAAASSVAALVTNKNH